MPYISSEKVKAIREEIKKTFPEFKFSVTRQHYSTVAVVVLSGPIPLLDKGSSREYECVNTFWINDHYKDGAKKDFLKKLNEITSRDCRIVSEDGDYGSTPNYYTDIRIGDFERPYVVTENKFVSTQNTFKPAEHRKGIKKIKARFGSKCTETGLYISKGDLMYYDYDLKKCYCMTSNTALELELKANDPDDKAARDEINAAEMIRSNEKHGFYFSQN